MDNQRTRAWRRFQNQQHRGRNLKTINNWWCGKKWKLLYLRSNKLARAAQLGFEYPRINNMQMLERDRERNRPLHILFVCSGNRRRSATAELLWRDYPGIVAHSVGTSRDAVRTVTVDDILWTDVIVVMEEKHRSRITARFPRLVRQKPIHVLDIADNYALMEPKLVELLRNRMGAVLLASPERTTGPASLPVRFLFSPSTVWTRTIQLSSSAPRGWPPKPRAASTMLERSSPARGRRRMMTITVR